MKTESIDLHATSKDKQKELQAFLGIISYLGKFSPSTADICESLRKLTKKLTWNATYQNMFDKAKATTKKIHA